MRDISKAVQQLLEARRSGVQVKPPFALPGPRRRLCHPGRRRAGDRSGLRLEGRRAHADRRAQSRAAARRRAGEVAGDVRRQGDAHDRRRDRDLVPYREGHRRAQRAGRARRGARRRGRRLRRHGGGRHAAGRFQVGRSGMAAGRQPDEPCAGDRRVDQGLEGPRLGRTCRSSSRSTARSRSTRRAGSAPSIRCARSPG